MLLKYCFLLLLFKLQEKRKNTFYGFCVPVIVTKVWLKDEKSYHSTRETFKFYKNEKK